MVRENNDSTINDKKIISRDYLAAYRTVLANERTFLAYIRTILVMAGGGVSLIKLFDHIVFQVLGWILLFLSIVLFVIAIVRFRRMRKLIRSQVDSDCFTCTSR